MKLTTITSSLRFKLIVSSVLIQAVFISILVFNSMHLIEGSLLSQWKLRVAELQRLLESSVAGHIIEQDLESIQEIFDENTKDQSINYLILLDSQSQPIVTSNWSDNSQLPTQTQSLNQLIPDDQSQFQGAFDIQVGGIHYGTILYGVSTSLFATSKTKLFNDSVIIAIFGIVLSSLALFLIGFWLTRNLRKLTDASDLFASGEFHTRVQVNTHDEISHLAHAFNNMADALDKRINDLRKSRSSQKELLEISNTEKARLSSLLAVMTRGIVFITKDNYVMYYNPAFAKIWGIHETLNLQNKRLSDLTKYLQARLAKECDDTMIFSKSLIQENDSIEFSLVNGTVVKQLAYRVFDEAKQEQGTLWIFEDITAERQTAKQLVYLAEHDFLTGLFNRRKFHEELLKQFATAERHRSSLALLFFDIDDFKFINDAYGHAIGDELLVKIAGDVGTLVRKDEMFCRLGGDEFAILLPDSCAEGASNLAQRILSAISNISLVVKGRNLSVTSSIGIAVYPDHGLDSEELLACADIAMYQAKEAGKNTFQVYEHSTTTSQHLMRRIDWENRIKTAIENKDFELNFQGVFDTTSKNLYFYEVLVRMKSYEKNHVTSMPAQFINIAERSGKIMQIDRIVLEKAIQILSAQPFIPALSVNISGRSFDSPTLDQFIMSQLEKYEVDASRLIIELTETAAVSDLQDAQRFIDNMRAYGCKIAIDDFGAGYSSFIYLKHLNVDIIKIDGLFIHDLVKDRDNQVFIKAIVDIATGLGRQTVAEFVEDEATLHKLKELGVDMAQGYYLQEPEEITVVQNAREAMV